jgi:hypothetical protein
MRELMRLEFAIIMIPDIRLRNEYAVVFSHLYVSYKLTGLLRFDAE